MILIDGKEYRNLEEQVLKNQQDIARHYDIDRVIADYGIHIIGRLDSASLLEGKMGEAFGNAYAIGTEPPYTFYIWTRNTPESGIDDGYWLNIGKLAIEGPEGPEGPAGETGATGQRGSKIFTFSAELGSQPTLSAFAGILTGDYALNLNTGEFWQYNGSTRWTLLGTIKGAQGIQGPTGPVGPQGPQGVQGIQGPQGAPGKFIHIVGTVANVDQLIPPADLNDLSAAYLVGTVAPYDLYVQVGETPATAQWMNQGHLNSGTIVTVNGVAQESWNADNKLDKGSNNNSVYANGPDGTLWMIPVADPYEAKAESAVPLYGVKGNLKALMNAGAIEDTDVVNVGYLNDQLANAGGSATPTVDAPLYRHTIYMQTLSGYWPQAYFTFDIFNGSEADLTKEEIFAYMYEKQNVEDNFLSVYNGFYTVEDKTSVSEFRDYPIWGIKFSASDAIYYQATLDTGEIIEGAMDASTTEITQKAVLVAQVDVSGAGGGSSSGGKLYRHDIIALYTAASLLDPTITYQNCIGNLTLYNSSETPFTAETLLAEKYKTAPLSGKISATVDDIIRAFPITYAIIDDIFGEGTNSLLISSINLLFEEVAFMVTKDDFTSFTDTVTEV